MSTRVTLKYVGPHDVVDLSGVGVEAIPQPDGALRPWVARGQLVKVGPETADLLLAHHHLDPAGLVHTWSWVPGDTAAERLVKGRELPHEVDARLMAAYFPSVAVPVVSGVSDVMPALDVPLGEDA